MSSVVAVYKRKFSLSVVTSSRFSLGSQTCYEDTIFGPGDGRKEISSLLFSSGSDGMFYTLTITPITISTGCGFSSFHQSTSSHTVFGLSPIGGVTAISGTE